MQDFIYFLKNILNQYKFNYALAFETSNYYKLNEKELKFIMYAQNNEQDSSSITNDYSVEVADSDKKTSVFDKIKNFFNKPKALPSADYTMDDWINSQKSPLSRMFSNMMHSVTNAIQNAISVVEAKKFENINTPTTPSQNFEMRGIGNDDIKPSATIIIPEIKSKASTNKVFSPLKVENITIDENAKGVESKDISSDIKSENTSVKENSYESKNTANSQKRDDSFSKADDDFEK